MLFEYWVSINVVCLSCTSRVVTADIGIKVPLLCPFMGDIIPPKIPLVAFIRTVIYVLKVRNMDLLHVCSISSMGFGRGNESAGCGRCCGPIQGSEQ